YGRFGAHQLDVLFGGQTHESSSCLLLRHRGPHPWGLHSHLSVCGGYVHGGQYGGAHGAGFAYHDLCSKNGAYGMASGVRAQVSARTWRISSAHSWALSACPNARRSLPCASNTKLTVVWSMV